MGGEPVPRQQGKQEGHLVYRDAARANWGGSWRMPTKAEMEALVALSGVWETYKGVNGYKFTGSNGKTLFLPATGFWDDTDPNYAGSDGYRSCGQSVRPVTE